MFEAQLHRKLTRPEEDMEDVLTSNVFGIWKYLPKEIAASGLLNFLQTSVRLDGTHFVGPEDINQLDIQLWRWLHIENLKGAEPDVLIRITDTNNKKWLILIESKYLSPKSSFADWNDPRPTDQLAREMALLRQIAINEIIDEYALIYLTAHTTIPIGDIVDSIEELETKTSISSRDQFYWATWRILPEVLNLIESESVRLNDKLLVSDLNTILTNLGLYYFKGIKLEEWTLIGNDWAFVPLYQNIIFNWRPFYIQKYQFHSLPVTLYWNHFVCNSFNLWRMNK